MIKTNHFLSSILPLLLCLFSINIIAQNLESCGLNDDPILNNSEADFLNTYLKGRRDGQDFHGIKVAFITGGSGNKNISKTEYFRELKTRNEQSAQETDFAFSLTEAEKLWSGGYDAVVAFKVLIPIEVRKRSKVVKSLGGDISPTKPLNTDSLLAAMRYDKFPDGVYLNFEQFRTKTPAFTADMGITQISPDNSSPSKRNIYTLKFKGDAYSDKFIFEEMYSFVKGDSIFMNSHPPNRAIMFSLCLAKGRFLTYRSGKYSLEHQMLMTTAGVAAGLIGEVIVMLTTADMAKYDFPLHTLSMRTGELYPLDKDFLLERLAGDSALLEGYTKEPKPKADETLLKYINLINDRLNK